jgi:hypothetical protein
MDECLRVLSNEHEAPTDEMFAHQVRLQLIADRVVQTTSSYTEDGQSEVHKATLAFYLKTFQSQLIDVRNGISSNADHNRKPQLIIHY